MTHNCMSFIEILRGHVKSPFLTAFAYGSGVFKQQQRVNASVESSKKMIDYLMVVEDNNLPQWHTDNYSVNPRDYPVLSRLAAIKSDLFLESVYYVPDVVTRSNSRIKYGVVGWNVLVKDLYTWNSLFLAGRLQKPTIRACTIESTGIDAAMAYNLDSALRYALLTVPDPSDFRSVMRGVVGLSYTQDPRLMFAESPDKIDNILRGQWLELEAMYLCRYEQMIREYKGLNDPCTRMQLIANLPSELKQELGEVWPVALAESNVIIDAVGRIVKRAAWRQVALGAISTSPIKSLGYLLAKMRKRFS